MSGIPTPSSPMTETQPTLQFVGFQIADQEYAFRIEQIQEIVILDQVTNFFGPNDTGTGLLNVLDLEDIEDGPVFEVAP